MKKVTYVMTCILTVSLLLSGCGQVAEKEKTNPQTNGTTNVQSENTTQATEELSDVIEFGTYYEEEARTKLAPIRWKVLGENDGYVLLLSEKIIDAKPFHSKRVDTDWENSTLRKWLNDDFYHKAFRKSEQQSMKEGTSLDDLVFLLSDEEVKQYLPDESKRTVAPTPFALKQGVYTNEVGESAWWLRSPVDDKTQTSYISSGGSFGNRPHDVDENIIGVRPAIRVKQSSLVSNDQKEDDSPAKESASGDKINVKKIWKKYDKDVSSMELAERENGTGYVLGVFGSYKEMDEVSEGDQVTIEGDFHILGSDNMVVIKNTKLQES